MYFNGCSFTYGYELKRIFEDRFSKIVSDNYGMQEWNNSKVGSSNDRIWRTTTTDMLLKKPKLAIIMWSGPNRTEFFHYARGKWGWKNATWKTYAVDRETWKATNSSHVSRSVDQSPKHYQLLDGYMREVRNVPWNIRYTFQYMISTKYFLEALKIPYLFYTFSSTQYVKFLDLLDWETWECTSVDNVSIELSKAQVIKELPCILEPGFYDLCKKHDLEIGTKDHPLEEGHQFMAEKIIKDIKKHGFHKNLSK